MKMLARAGLAMLAALLIMPVAACAQAQGCAAKTATGNCVPGLVLMDPSTGLPYAASGGGGGGGSGLGGLANAASPSYSEGGTVTNLSFDLTGYQRVRAKQDGTWTVAVTGTFWQATQPVSGTFWQSTQPISAASLPLPAGAATSALQTTGNTSLATIATNSGTAATAANQLANVAWADQDAQTLASSGTYSGTSRDVGVAAGTANTRAYFNAVFISSQTGTAYIQGSSDGSTWISVTTATNGTVAASTPLILSVPVLFRYYRAQIVNSASSATITVHTSFTGA